MSQEFAKDFKIHPEGMLALKPAISTKVSVENTGDRTLTYKLKTTRPASVKPTKAFGILKSHDSDAFKVKFQPKSDEKPFAEGDRVTVLVGVLSDSSMKPEHYWKQPNVAQEAHRIVLKLSAEGKEKKKKKEASEREEEPKSEESEVETSEASEGSESSESEH